jgi:hypothetical protein
MHLMRMNPQKEASVTSVSFSGLSDSMDAQTAVLTCELRPYTAFKGRRSATSAIPPIQRFDDGTKSLPSFSQPFANTLTERPVVTGDQDANLVRRQLPWEPCLSPSLLAPTFSPL